MENILLASLGNLPQCSVCLAVAKTLLMLKKNFLVLHVCHLSWSLCNTEKGLALNSSHPPCGSTLIRPSPSPLSSRLSSPRSPGLSLWEMTQSHHHLCSPSVDSLPRIHTGKSRPGHSMPSVASPVLSGREGITSQPAGTSTAEFLDSSVGPIWDILRVLWSRGDVADADPDKLLLGVWCWDLSGPCSQIYFFIHHIILTITWAKPGQRSLQPTPIADLWPLSCSKSLERGQSCVQAWSRFISPHVISLFVMKGC